MRGDAPIWLAQPPPTMQGMLTKRARGRVCAVVGGLCAICATGAGLAQTRADCVKAQTAPEITECLGSALVAAEAKLATAYRRALTSARKASGRPLDGPGKGTIALRSSQRAWVALKAKRCGDDVASEWRGGSGAISATLSCEIELVRRRTGELDRLGGRH